MWTVKINPGVPNAWLFCGSFPTFLQANEYAHKSLQFLLQGSKVKIEGKFTDFKKNSFANE